MRRGNGAIRMGAACALLFASLSLVVWRQSRALDELRRLDSARAERAQLQAERSALQREIRELESRPRILAVAGERFGLRVPTHSEIVFLQAPPAEPPAGVMAATGGRASPATDDAVAGAAGAAHVTLVSSGEARR